MGCRCIPALTAVEIDPAGLLVVTEAPEALAPRDTLRDVIHRGERLPTPDTLRILKEIARGLDSLPRAHAAGGASRALARERPADGPPSQGVGDRIRGSPTRWWRLARPRRAARWSWRLRTAALTSCFTERPRAETCTPSPLWRTENAQRQGRLSGRFRCSDGGRSASRRASQRRRSGGADARREGRARGARTRLVERRTGGVLSRVGARGCVGARADRRGQRRVAVDADAGVSDHHRPGGAIDPRGGCRSRGLGCRVRRRRRSPRQMARPPLLARCRPRRRFKSRAFILREPSLWGLKVGPLCLRRRRPDRAFVRPSQWRSPSRCTSSHRPTARRDLRRHRPAR